MKISIFVKIFDNLDLYQNLQKSRFQLKFSKNLDFIKKFKTLNFG